MAVSHSKYNRKEAEVVYHIIYDLFKAGVNRKDIGVITVRNFLHLLTKAL